MQHIDYFVSPISTFAYLAGNRLEEVAQKHGATISYKPFDIISAFARTGGVMPAQRHPSRQEYRLQEMARISKRMNLPFNLPAGFTPPNPAPAAYAIIAAQNAGGGDLGGLVQAILKACFNEQKNIAEDDVIMEALSANGFDPALAQTGLMAGAETYARNTEEAVSRGVFGAPFYIVGDARFWGQDRLEYLDEYLEENA
jgi:2-hydroxychromene-2-carboxylate isomerase